IPVFLQASLLDAADVPALDGLGHAYAEVGSVDQSIATFEKAAAISADPRFRLLSAVQLPLVYQSADDFLQWPSRLIANVQRLRSSGIRLNIQSSVATPVFSLAHQGFNDREIMASIAQLHEAPAIPADLWRPNPSERLRIGFLSSYFGSHTIGKLARGLIARLSHRNLDVTVFSVDRH